MAHDFARGFVTLDQEITRDHLPVQGRIPAWLAGSLLRNGPAQYEWKPERGSRFMVMRKDDGQVVHIFQGEAFFAFHHINAFERDHEVVVDIATMRDTWIMLSSPRSPRPI
jgi:carotenoid cleavage dioxygenase-like enzyme